MELKGKKVAFLGDSITEGAGVAKWKNCYHQRIGEKAGLAAVYVDAIGGTRIAHQSHASEYPRHDLALCGRMYNLPKDADLVIVFGGTNDYGHGDAPLGTPEDTTCDTFCGALDHMMRYLKDTYKKVVFMAPARRDWCDHPSGHAYKRGNAHVLSVYVDAIVACGKKYDIPVLNLFDALPIDPCIPEQRTAFTTDGLHLNDNGHAVLADTLLAFLEGLEE